MPVDMAALAADLAAESAVTRALVAYFDEVAVQSAVRPDEFRATLTARPRPKAHPESESR
jgi:hypothetical protein